MRMENLVNPSEPLRLSMANLGSIQRFFPNEWSAIDPTSCMKCFDALYDMFAPRTDNGPSERTRSSNGLDELRMNTIGFA